MLKKCLMVILMMVVLTGLAVSQEIIIESRQEGKNYKNYSETKGVWYDSTAKSIAEGCSPETIGSRFVDVEIGAPDNECRFTPEITQAGLYDIFTTWGRSGNALQIKYVVNTGTREEVVMLDQAGWGGAIPINAGIWIPIGTFELPAGTSAYVAIQTSTVKGKPDGVNRGRVYSDAVKFVLNTTGTKLTPPTPAPASAAATAPNPTQPKPTPAVSVSTAQYSPFNTPVAATPAPTPAANLTSPFATPVPGQATPSPFSVPVTAMPWLSSYPEAIQSGKVSGKSILLFFTSPGGMAQNFEENVLSAPVVKVNLTQNYILCKLDIAQNKQICDYYGVANAPVIVFLDSRGYSRARIDTVLTVDQILPELDKYK